MSVYHVEVYFSMREGVWCARFCDNDVEHAFGAGKTPFEAINQMIEHAYDCGDIDIDVERVRREAYDAVWNDLVLKSKRIVTREEE